MHGSINTSTLRYFISESNQPLFLLTGFQTARNYSLKPEFQNATDKDIVDLAFFKIKFDSGERCGRSLNEFVRAGCVKEELLNHLFEALIRVDKKPSLTTLGHHLYLADDVLQFDFLPSTSEALIARWPLQQKHH